MFTNLIDQIIFSFITFSIFSYLFKWRCRTFPIWEPFFFIYNYTHTVYRIVFIFCIYLVICDDDRRNPVRSTHSSQPSTLFLCYIQNSRELLTTWKKAFKLIAKINQSLFSLFLSIGKTDNINDLKSNCMLNGVEMLLKCFLHLSDATNTVKSFIFQ